MTRLGEHERLTASLRFAVAGVSLAVFLTDPNEHPERRPFAVAVLLAFALYSAALALVGARRRSPVSAAVAPWIDIGWVTLLVGVSAGLSGVFYPLYLFAVLEASFGRGFRPGIAAAAVSVISFAGVGALTTPRGPRLDLSPFLYRPLYLAVLGYLTSVWGGHEVRSRARLSLLKDVTDLSNPRFGVDQTMGKVLEAIRAFYGADACRLVVGDGGPGPWMQAAERGAVPSRRLSIPAELSAQLLPPPATAAFRLRAAPRRPWATERPPAFLLHDPPAEDAVDGPTARARALLTALEAEAVLSVPFRPPGGGEGRLYVIRREGPAFERAEIGFLGLVLDQVSPVLENIRLVDRLASDAADDARRRIALDLHDSVIQPYLGLRLGLSAAQTALAAGREEEARGHVERLVSLADQELQAMRGYVRGLKAGGPGGGALLDEGVRRFCARVGEATGIAVEVEVEGTLDVGDRLGAEVLQMVAEALSNVRRHTTSGWARVRLASRDGRLTLAVENDAPSGAPPAAFRPRSITERAEGLGGTVRVERTNEGRTAVRIEIPL